MSAIRICPAAGSAARIVLHKTGGGHSAAIPRSPSRFMPTPGAHRHSSSSRRTARRLLDVPVSGLVELPNATFSHDDAGAGNVTQMTLGVDTTSSDRLQLPGTGKQFVLFPDALPARSRMPANRWPRVHRRDHGVERAGDRAVRRHRQQQRRPPEAVRAGLQDFDSAVRRGRALHHRPARCTGAARIVWALVDVPQGSLRLDLFGHAQRRRADDSVVARRRPARNNQLHVTGPGTCRGIGELSDPPVVGCGAIDSQPILRAATMVRS